MIEQTTTIRAGLIKRKRMIANVVDGGDEIRAAAHAFIDNGGPVDDMKQVALWMRLADDGVFEVGIMGDDYRIVPFVPDEEEP